MPVEKVLTLQELAEQLIAEEFQLEFWGFTQLDDAAAESLSKHEGQLYLNALTSLSDTAAESLGNHRGTLHLDSLSSLSEAAADWRACLTILLFGWHRQSCLPVQKSSVRSRKPFRQGTNKHATLQELERPY